MCDPVSLSAMALSAGGTFLEQREASKNAKRVQNAKNNAYEAGMIRQKQYADEAGASFEESVDQQGSENFEDQRQSEINKIKQAFSESRNEPEYNIALPSSASKNVVLARRAAADNATAETDRDVNNLADLSSYGGATFNQGLSRNAFGRNFGNLQDKANRDANLISLDMSAAGNNASKSPSLFPTLLKLGGQGLGMYSAGTGIGTFGDKITPGKVVNGVALPGKKTPGLITTAKNGFSKAFGGLY